MRLSVSTRRGWILSIAALALIASPGAQMAFAQDPPEIVEQPESATVCEGNAVTFTVVAIGDPPLDYQWYEDGAAITDATEASYTIDPVELAADGTAYTVEVSNDFGSAESDAAILTVIEDIPPSITTQPVAQEVCDGESVTFEVTAEGAEPLSYQWYRDGVAIFGATEPSYTIDPAGPDAAADFSVVVSNVCDSIESDVVTLTVHQGPNITAQPQGQTLCEDEGFTLSVSATGFGTILYQWRVDGVDIPGAESDELTIDPATRDDSGNYDVVLTDDCGVATSNVAQVAVKYAPSIVSHPADSVACRDGSVTFEVVVDGSPTLSYQWYHNGVEITGATSSIYEIDIVELGDAGTYHASVQNTCGQAVSDTATLTVNTGPAITAHPQSRVECDGASETTFSVTATGSEPLAYLWRKDGNVITGAESSTYTISPVTSDDAGSYDVLVANSCGSATSDVAMLAVVEEAPVIVEQPQGAALCDNGAESITFSVSATPADGLTYQWRKDGVEIGAANSATYSISVVTVDDAGDYDVVVGNPCGETVSEIATLVVADAWPDVVDSPEDQTVCEGESVTLGVTVEGPEPLSYQWYLDETPITGATDPSYTIDSALLADAGDYRVMVSNPCGSVMSAAATLAVSDEAATIAQQPQAVTACEGATVAFSVVADGDAPFEYQWYRDGSPIDGATADSYTAEDIAVGDAGDYSVVVTNACGSAQSETAALTVNTAVVITTQPVDQALCENSSVTFSVEVGGTQPYSYQWRKDGVEISGATGAEYVIEPITPDDAASYDVVVTNPCASVTSTAAALTVYVGPTITQQPEAPELCVGESVTLTVAADGTEPFDYQWYKDGNPLTGETADTLTIDGLTTGDSGQYYAVVANLCEQAASDTVAVVVDEPPLVTAQPEAAIIARGQTNVFCVSVTGTSPFEYQWRQDGVNISGANEDCYETDEEGAYDCVVTNRCDQVVSDDADLTIASRVTVSAETSDDGIRLGDSATLTATAERGLAPYSYLWSTGQTARRIVVEPTRTTIYTVRATDALGQTATAEVTVAVATPLTVQARASAYVLQLGEESELTASVLTGGLVPFTYAWSTGETTASIVVAPVIDTIYTVTVTDALGQTGSASITITVNLETEDDQSEADQPSDEDDDGQTDDQTQDDDQGDTTGDDSDDQSEQEEAASGLCPLLSLSMISMLIAGLCWTRGAGPRRRR